MKREYRSKSSVTAGVQYYSIAKIHEYESQMSQFFDTVRAFLFDMDGTLYLGDRLLPGARELLHHLLDAGIPFYLLTNNSSRARRDYWAKLQHMGLPVEAEQIITSGEAAAEFLREQYPAGRVFLLGTPSLEAEFFAHGFTLSAENPDFVVLGYDTTLTYAKLAHFVRLVAAGLPYYATHADVNCPAEDGYLPDAGAFIALIQASSGRQPDLIFGKPHPPILQVVEHRTGYKRPDLLMVGDRLYTDIAMGMSGVRTVLVLTGETRQEDLPGSPYRPDVVVPGLPELLELLRPADET
jgi:HAD superfamily hydrolase (TIGR01450 family)